MKTKRKTEDHEHIPTTGARTSGSRACARALIWLLMVALPAAGQDREGTRKPNAPTRFLVRAKNGRVFPPFGGPVSNRVILRGSASGDGSSVWVNEGAGCRLTLPFSLFGLQPDYAAAFGGAGAEQILQGHITRWYGYQVRSDPKCPLVFQWVRDLGCVRLCGRGTLKRPDGVTHELGAEEDTAFWVAKAQSEDVLTREGAAQALGYLFQAGRDGEKTIKTLVRLLGDSEMAVRRDAAESLGRIADPRTSEALVPLLRDEAEDWWVAEVAAESLAKIPGGLGAESVRTLSEALGGGDVKAAALSAQALAAGGEEAVAPLVAALGRGDPAVRENAARSLAALGNANAIEPLKAMLAKEKNGKVKDAAGKALELLAK